MADKKDVVDKVAENPDNTQPENVDVNNVSLMEDASKNSNIESENMEVHKHPHHVTHKKKWHEYLLEFLMIFLAVFLGFVSENIRERHVEQERAHSLAKSLLADLAYDTSKLGFTARIREVSILNCSNIFNELKKPEDKRNNINLQNMAISIGNHLYFLSYSGTFEQIKNSGALRYFPDSISRALTYYEQSVKQNALTQSMEGNYINTSLQPFLLTNINYKNAQSSVSINTFDPVLLADINSINPQTSASNKEDSLIETFQNTDPNFRTHLYAHTNYCLKHNKFLFWEYKYLREQAISIMNLLKKEYDISD